MAGAVADPTIAAPKVTTVYADEKSALVDILDRAAESMPEPSKGIDDLIAGENPLGTDASNDAGNTSSNPFNNGPAIPSGFDPQIHEADEAGNPVFNSDGTLRRKRGRKPGQSYGFSSHAPYSANGIANLGDGTPAGDQAEFLKRRAAANAATAILVGAATGIFGNEWQPIADKKSGLDERANLQRAFEDYFEAAGTIDLPPGLALAVSVAAYALPRFGMPQTKEKAIIIATKTGGLIGWIKGKFSSSKPASMKLAA